jgi:glutathione synthase/RimK-type ligase-like ATP-grasp enzyme
MGPILAGARRARHYTCTQEAQALTPTQTVTPAAVDAARKPPAFMLMGVPDDQRGRISHSAWNKPPGMVMQGTASFLGQLQDLPWNALRIYFGGEKLEMDARLPLGPSINFMADADLYPRALRQAAIFVQKVPAPCFNHPAAVMRTTRDEVARRLAGIEGLQVPTTVRVKATRYAQLQAAAEAAGLRFPLIVRMAGDHGGVSTVRVDGSHDWEAANPLPWGGRDAYLTQFVDFQDGDGFHRKMRLAVVGDEVFLKHRYVSREWLVHFKSHTQETEAAERLFMQRFEEDTLARVKPAVLEVARRLGLDYFGMDVSLRGDGSMLLFEANATMNILSVHRAVTDMWEAPAARIQSALRALLAQPARWRGAPQ